MHLEAKAQMDFPSYLSLPFPMSVQSAPNGILNYPLAFGQQLTFLSTDFPFEFPIPFPLISCYLL